MTCKHAHGDMVSGAWLCGQCYSLLPSRPYRTFIVAQVDEVGPDHRPMVKGGERHQPGKQQIAFAPVSAAPNGVTLAKFVAAIASRLIAQTRGGMAPVDASDYAIEILRTFGEEFGAQDVEWTTGGAWDLVSEDMGYWDEDGGGGNA